MTALAIDYTDIRLERVRRTFRRECLESQMWQAVEKEINAQVQIGVEVVPGAEGEYDVTVRSVEKISVTVEISGDTLLGWIVSDRQGWFGGQDDGCNWEAEVMTTTWRGRGRGRYVQLVLEVRAA